MYNPTQLRAARQGQQITQKPQFAQYQAPNNQPTEQLQEQQVNTMLQSGGSLSPDVVAKLKARSKQQQLSMADQAKQQAGQFLAQRGFSPAGGIMQGANAAIDFNTINQLLSQNRDTDIQAATQNRQDNMSAVQLANDFMNARNARAGDSFRNVLAGQGAQADSNFRIEGFNEDQRRADNGLDLSRWVAEQQAGQASDDSRLRNISLLHGIDMDNRNFGEGVRRFDNSLGFNYNQLNQQADQSLMDYLMRTFG
jgi:hypothetical protein